MRTRQPAVYILASRMRGTLYVGVASDLPQRVWQHRMGLVEGFIRRYRVHRPVWYELHATMSTAIAREGDQGVEAGVELELTEAFNPARDDLYDSLFG